MRLLLGVNDIPYAQALSTEQRRVERWRQGKRPWQRIASTVTTGDVAEILESRYGIMQFFWDTHGQEVADQIVDTLEGRIETMMMRGDIFDQGGDIDLSVVEEMFRTMLDNKELDGRVSGVPTAAAQAGVSHRMMRPNLHRSARPSFIDTGLYQASFRAVLEE